LSIRESFANEFPLVIFSKARQSL